MHHPRSGNIRPVASQSPRDAIGEFERVQERYEERAAIKQYCAGMSKERAEMEAEEEMRTEELDLLDMLTDRSRREYLQIVRESRGIAAAMRLEAAWEDRKHGK